VVKVNAGERLRMELAPEVVEPVSTSPWGRTSTRIQRAEGRYRLMPDILTALRDFTNPFSILTKGSLDPADLRLLQECAEVTEVGANVSVGFVDRELWRSRRAGAPFAGRSGSRCVRSFTRSGWGAAC
jgi:DNA repair photolyase